MGEAMKGHCHCGAVTVAMIERPTQILQCNCTLCTRTGWMGVYGHPGNFHIIGAENCTAYVQGDRTITVWHCRTCGIATHWTPLTAPQNRMGVNIRLVDPELWSDIPIQQTDGRSY